MNGDRLNPAYGQGLAGNLPWNMGNAEANPNSGQGLAGPRPGYFELARADKLEALEKRVQELEHFRRFVTDRILGEGISDKFPMDEKNAAALAAYVRAMDGKER